MRFSAILAALGMSFGLAGQQPKLKVGDMAPDFTLTSDTGKQVRLSDYRGKTVVLAFFIKAFTSG
jgi:peroxiredoxin Q/BCP